MLKIDFSRLNSGRQFAAEDQYGRGPFVSSVMSRRRTFHMPRCPWVAKITQRKSSIERASQALAAGKKRCHTCRP